MLVDTERVVQTICAWCDATLVGDGWVAGDRRGLRGEWESVSHAICPSCVERLNAAWPATASAAALETARHHL